MAGVARPRVNPFGDQVGYVRITCLLLMQQAQNSRYPLSTRVEFAALARCNRAGHAEFGPGELCAVLGKNTVGRWEDARGDSVDRAIRKAKHGLIIGPDSGRRCLTVNDGISQGRGALGCTRHRRRFAPVAA